MLLKSKKQRVYNDYPQQKESAISVIAYEFTVVDVRSRNKNEVEMSEKYRIYVMKI